MTDPLDIAQIVLLRLAELLRKLPPEQLAELYAGTATLEVVPKGGRAAKRAPATAPAPVALAVSVAQVSADLSTIHDRVAATRYVEDLSLPAAQLRALAKELGIAVGSKATKPAVVHEIVQWTVGRRLDSAAVSRSSRH